MDTTKIVCDTIAVKLHEAVSVCLPCTKEAEANCYNSNIVLCICVTIVVVGLIVAFIRWQNKQIKSIDLQKIIKEEDAKTEKENRSTEKEVNRKTRVNSLFKDISLMCKDKDGGINTDMAIKLLNFYIQIDKYDKDGTEPKITSDGTQG